MIQAQVLENQIPTPWATNIERCGSGSVTFTAIGCTTGYNTKWYDFGLFGISKEVGSGTTFTTPVLYETAMYFVDCVSSEDSSIRGQSINVFANVFLSAEVNIFGSDMLCSNNEGIYRGFPKGGTFSLPEGLPSGFLTIDTTNSFVTMNPGYDVPTFSFSYTFTNSLPECSGTATKTVTRESAVLPTVNNPTIYPGQTATLIVENCAGEVEWSLYSRVYAYTKRIHVSPAATSEYYAECNVDGYCDTRISATVTVIPKPESVVKISGPDTVCLSRLPLTYVATPVGGKFVLPKALPFGAFTVSDNTLTVNPGFDITNTSFSYEFTSADSGKVATASATKYLTFIPVANPTITEPVTICKGGYVILEVKNCPGKVIWNTREQYPTIIDYPTTATEYSARCVTGGCDTTLTTKVTVSGIQPYISVVSSVCNEDGKSYDLVFDASGGATVKTNLGMVEGNKIIGIPSGRRVEITASLNGCTSTSGFGISCGSTSYCKELLYPVISSSAASCSENGAKSDASITLNNVYADRYSFGKTPADLTDYASAIVVDLRKITISDLPNPTSAAGQAYTIRLYIGRGDDTCSRDTIIVVPYRDCAIACTKPDAGNDFFVSKYRK